MKENKTSLSQITEVGKKDIQPAMNKDGYRTKRLTIKLQLVG